MPFDGITAHCVAKELNEVLQNARIRKVSQPEADEIILTLNKGKENYLLLISVSSNNARIHLTSIKKENPKQAPAFCMSLRKYLTGAVISEITTQGADRIIEIDLDSRNEFGEPLKRKLICEMTGRNANLILCAEENGEWIITDSLKRVGFSSSRYRQILPGLSYLAPPSEGRLDPRNISKSELIELIESEQTQTAEGMITSKFLGLSPAFAREVLYQAGIEGNTKLSTYNRKQFEAIADSFLTLIAAQEKPLYKIYSAGGKLLDYYPVELSHLGASSESFESISEMLEHFYQTRDMRMRFQTKSANLRHQLETLRKRASKKLSVFEKDFQKLQSNEKNRIYGDLITANIWMLERGMKEAELINYMEEEQPTVKVQLKVNETPSQNAQRYYKKYAKGKRALIELEKQRKMTQESLYYIESLLESLKNSTTTHELDEIRYEFYESDLSSKTTHQRKIKKPKPSEPMHFVSSEGFDIYVGKNNYQNDYISTRLGVDEDCWLHVKDAPGSHVLIVADGRFIPEETVLEGGMLAAWYSSMRLSENVPVDYLEFKDLKKPKRAKPGMVVFTTHDTMYITPNRQKVAEIEKRDEPL